MKMAVREARSNFAHSLALAEKGETVTTHRDAFDEMLLIHAQRLGAQLLTRDGDLRNHPLVAQL